MQQDKWIARQSVAQLTFAAVSVALLELSVCVVC